MGLSTRATRRPRRRSPRSRIRRAGCWWIPTLLLATAAPGQPESEVEPGRLTPAVEIDAALAFESATGEEVVVEDGFYGLSAQGEHLALEPGEGDRIVLRAQASTHEEELTVPIARLVAGGGEGERVLGLLEPGGRMLVARGLEAAVRTRGAGDLGGYDWSMPNHQILKVIAKLPPPPPKRGRVTLLGASAVRRPDTSPPSAQEKLRQALRAEPGKIVESVQLHAVWTPRNPVPKDRFTLGFSNFNNVSPADGVARSWPYKATSPNPAMLKVGFPQRLQRVPNHYLLSFVLDSESPMRLVLYGSSFLYRYDLPATGPQLVSFALLSQSGQGTQVDLTLHPEGEYRWTFHAADLSWYAYQ